MIIIDKNGTFDRAMLVHNLRLSLCRKPTESTGKVVFELKPELHVEYNPCFYHYNKSEQSKVNP